jgi:methylated-DNA-[protein]-cysteine S-methyltransferase
MPGRTIIGAFGDAAREAAAVGAPMLGSLPDRAPIEREESVMASTTSISRPARPGEMRRLDFARIDSPLGPIAIAAAGDVLVALEFVDAGDRFERSLRRRFGAVDLLPRRDPLGVATRLARYFKGRLDAIEDVAVDPGGTPFQQRVWAALRTIRCGTTLSYGALAAALGQPTATRAVGLANGANPISIVVPCHRVIGSDGTLTGYGGGVARKRWLLEHEGVLTPSLRLA